MPVALYSGTGFQTALASCSVDPTVSDGSNSTGPDQSGAVNGSTSITAIYDAGASVSFTNIESVLGYEGTPSVIWEISSDGIHWTGLSGTSLTNHGGTFSLEGHEVFGGLPATGRFIRESITDSATGGATCRASIREIVPSYTGAPVDYTDDTLVRVGLKPSGDGVSAGADTTSAKMGLRPSEIDVLTLSGGGIAYAEPNVHANLGLKPSSADTRVAFEAAQSNVALSIGSTDVQRNVSIPFRFYDAPRVGMGLVGPNSTVAAMSDTPRSAVGLCAETSELSVGAEAPTGKLGLRCASVSSQNYFDIPATVKAGLKPSASDFGKSAQSALSTLGLKSAAISTGVFADAPMSAAGLKATVADAAVLADTAQVKIGLNAPGVSRLVSVDIAQAKVGLSVAAQTNGTSVRETGLVKIGLKSLASAGEGRGYSDVVMCRIGLRVSCVEVMGSQD